MSGRWIILSAAGIVLAALMAYYPDVADDFDIWWHLKYGEHFVRNSTWSIDHSAFSWTPSDPTWIYVTWMGSSLLYLVHQIGGYPLLVVLQWLIFLGMAGLFYGFARLCRSQWTVVHLAGLLLAGVAMNPIALYIKPELFTLLFFTTAVFIYFASKVTLKNLFWIYPPLFLVWVNTHGGFINGLGFITLALIVEAASYAGRHPDRLPQALLWKFAASVSLAYLAALINPQGVAYWIMIFKSAAQGESHIRTVTAYFPLWNYLFPATFMFRKINAAWAMVLMAAVLLALAAAAWKSRRRLSPPLLTLNFFFFIFGFSLFRASIYFCILWLFSCQYLLRCGQWRLNLRAAIPAFLLSVAAAAMIFHEMVAYNVYDSRFGSRIASFVPAAEADFVARYKLPGPLFNDYLSGGHLIWGLPPDYKVFIDPRYGPYASTGVWQAYLALLAGNDLKTLDIKYRCNTAIILTSQHRLVDLFLRSPDWVLAYFDKAAVVFTRKAGLGASREQDWRGDMLPEKFRDISNPRILAAAFYLYCHYHLPSAPVILGYYEANVRNSYKFKPLELLRMKTVLNQLGIRTEMAHN